MRLVGGGGRGREGRGWGQTSQKGRNSRWGHRQAPPLPQGQPKARFLCPAPHWGPRSRGSRAHCRPHLGEEGGVVKLCSCKANPVLVRPARCVWGAACPHTLPTVAPAPSPDLPTSALGAPQPLKSRARGCPGRCPLLAPSPGSACLALQTRASLSCHLYAVASREFYRGGI